MTSPSPAFATALAAVLLDFFSRLVFGPPHFAGAVAEPEDRGRAPVLDPDHYWTDQLLP